MYSKFFFYIHLFQESLTDKEVIKKVENEVTKVISNMADRGHRPDDISHDTAALNTELAKKDRELTAKVFSTLSIF